MQQIKEQLDLWCSIGISENKFLAKMASEMKKPLGITELWLSDIAKKLWPLPVGEMYGIGSKTAEKLANYGIKTIGDLAKMDRSFLLKTFGKSGDIIYQHAHGIDNETVINRNVDSMKSIGRATTLSEDAYEPTQIRSIFMELAEDVCRTARKHGKKGHTVRITLKYTDFTTITRQTSMPSSNSGYELFKYGYELLQANWNSCKPVRLVGITLSGFESNISDRQISFFDASAKTDRDNNLKADFGIHSDALDQVMDKIKDKHGNDIVTRGSLLNLKNNSKKEKRKK